MADLSLDGLTLLTPIPGAAETYFVSASADFRGTVTQLFTGRTLSATVALGIRSSGAAFDLQLASSEVLTANRALNIVLGDAARTLTVGASASVSGTNTGDQTSVSGNAGTVTTNANLTGHITSSGNAAVLGAFTVAQLSTAISDANISGTNTGDQTTVSGNAGTATALATARAIYGNNFDGTAALAQIIGSAFGGTGNGFTKFSGPTTAEKTFTLPDASATIARTDAAQTFTGNQTLLGAITKLSASSVFAVDANLTTIQIGGNNVIDGTTARAATTTLALRQNMYFDGSNLKYVSTDFASDYYQVSGTHNFRVAPSGTAGATVTGFGTTVLSILNGGWVRYKELTTNPTTSDLTADDHMAFYRKADKAILAYNQGGTMKYIVFTLDGSTTTFTNSSSAP